MPPRVPAAWSIGRVGCSAIIAVTLAQPLEAPVQLTLRFGLLAYSRERHLLTAARAVQVTTEDGHTVTAESIVQATDSPINVNLAIHARQTAYRSYVTGYKIPKACTDTILAGSVYCYISSLRLHRRLCLYLRSLLMCTLLSLLSGGCSWVSTSPSASPMPCREFF